MENIRIEEADYSQVLQLRQEGMYPDRSIDFVKLSDDEMGIHLGVYSEHHLISVVSIFMKNREVQFRKLATRESMRGQNFGSHLMKWLIDYVRDMKLERLWCNARVESVGFYKKNGLVETDETFTRDGNRYVIMELRFTYE